MREQLTIKKQKLIDELKDMRKEFALNKDSEMNFTSGAAGKPFGATRTSEFSARNQSVALAQTGGLTINTN